MRVDNKENRPDGLKTKIKGAVTTGLQFLFGSQQEETKKTQNRKSRKNFSEEDEEPIDFDCELSNILLGEPKKPVP